MQWKILCHLIQRAWAIPLTLLSQSTGPLSPLMKKLGWPTLFCHTLSIAPDGTITGYKLRQQDSKRHAVISLKSLYYKTIAVGDSYNDITMLKEADAGILHNPPENVKDEFPEFPLSYSFDELKAILKPMLANG